MEFEYRVKTEEGQSKHGFFEADSEQLVLDMIRANGWIPVDVRSNGFSVRRFGKQIYGMLNHLPLRAKSIFFRQLSVMLASAIPVERALLILIEEENNRQIKKCAKQLLENVRSGKTVSAALNMQREHFTKLETAIIRAGDEAGLLDKALLRVSEFLRSQDMLRVKIVTALIYPITVLFVAFTVLVLVTVFVLPQFENSFHQMKIEMPAFSAAVFAFGNWMRKYWYFVPLTLFMLWLFLLYVRNYCHKAARTIDILKLKIPLFGKMLYKAAVARSFRTLGMLLESGIGLLNALRLSSDVAGNIVLQENFNDMLSAAEEGKSMYNTLSKSGTFPLLVSQIVKIGEETGQTAQKFIELADLYEQELEDTIKQLGALLEPVMVIIVGIMVAIMLFAIYLPIMSAIRNFI